MCRDCVCVGEQLILRDPISTLIETGLTLCFEDLQVALSVLLRSLLVPAVRRVVPWHQAVVTSDGWQIPATRRLKTRACLPDRLSLGRHHVLRLPLPPYILAHSIHRHALAANLVPGWHRPAIEKYVVRCLYTPTLEL